MNIKNNLTLIGRLTHDPELKTTQTGISVCGFSIAVDRKYVAQGEEKITDYIPIVCWRKTAEFVSKYFKRGSAIIVSGELQTRKYIDKNGNNRIAFEVVAEEVAFYGSKVDNHTSQQENEAPAANGGFAGATSIDDDLPF